MWNVFSRSPAVHIVNPFWNPYGGTEQRAVNLFKTLKSECDVRLWCPTRPHPGLDRVAPIRQIKTNHLRYPRGGVLVIVGVYFKLGHWVKLTKPDRTVIIYNTPDPEQLLEKRDLLLEAGHRRIELVYASEDLRATTGLEGTLETSLIDLDKFSPAQVPEPRPFTIGRLSREVDIKHHAGDPDLYVRLAAAGVGVSIMGPSARIEAKLTGVAGVRLLRTGEIEASEFLKSIDCFFYRTSDSWFEAWGRVVLEAMATGLPVVCGRRGGYQTVIEHGVNGFLFDYETQAVALLERLRDDEALRRRVGAAARVTAQTLMNKARLDIIDFYTGPARTARPLNDADVSRPAS